MLSLLHGSLYTPYKLSVKGAVMWRFQMFFWVVDQSSPQPTAHLPAVVERRPPPSLHLPGAAGAACWSLQSAAWPSAAVQVGPQPPLARCSGCRHLHAEQGCGYLARCAAKIGALLHGCAWLAASFQLHRGCTEAWPACGWRLQQSQSTRKQLQRSTQGSAHRAAAFIARNLMLQPCHGGSRPRNAPPSPSSTPHRRLCFNSPHTSRHAFEPSRLGPAR